MKAKSLKNQTFLKTKKISKPTDFASLRGFRIINQAVILTKGLNFSAFLSAILTKYQSLQLSKKYANKDNFEFWYTERETKKDMGLSYYIRNQCIKEGERLGLWKCEVKYNIDFNSNNNVTHFTIDWDKMTEFFMQLEDEEIEENLDADEELVKEAIRNEKERLLTPSNEIEILDKDVLDFVNDMARQEGVRNKESYKLTILNKYYNNDKKTMKNIQLFLYGKRNMDNMKSDGNYQDLIYRFFYHDNFKYYIQNIQKNDEIVSVYGASTYKEAKPILLRIPINKFEEFEKSLFVNED